MALPTDFASNNFWYTVGSGGTIFSDLGTTPAVDGGTIEQFSDSSGKGANATQPTSGSRPTYVAASGAVRIQSGQHLILPNVFGVGGGSPATEGELHFLIRLAARSGSNGWSSFGTDQNSHMEWGDGHIYDNSLTTARKDTGTHPFPTYDLLDWFVYSIASKNGDWRQYINGVQTYSDLSNTFAPGVAAPTIGVSTNTAYQWNGYLRQAFGFTAFLADADRTALINTALADVVDTNKTRLTAMNSEMLYQPTGNKTRLTAMSVEYLYKKINPLQVTCRAQIIG